MKKGTVIGNVNVLDLTKATAESVAPIKEIGNANMVFYSRETAGLLHRLNLGNVNVSFETPAPPKVVIGHLTITPGYFAGLAEPLVLAVVGEVLVEPGVTAEEIDKGLRAIAVVGKVICPEPLLGAIQAKTAHLVGQTETYSTAGRLVKGSLLLDEGALAALDDASELVVLGSLRLPRVLPNDLLAAKIAKVQVLGSVRCPEENAAVLRARLADGSGRVKVVPAGFVVVDKPLLLDSVMLEALSVPRLYCLERVQVDPEVDAALLDARLETLVGRQLVLCPVALKGVLARKCDLLQTQVIFYEGTLWVVDGEERLAASRFAYLEGKATLLVEGELTVDAEVEPALLTERLAKVHNQGMIYCTPEQEGAIQARLGLNDGCVSSQPEQEAEGTHIGNINHLVL